MTYSTVGGAIKNARNIYGLTLKDLGEEVGVSHAFLSRIENNKAKPSKELIEKISNVIDPKGSLGLKSEINVLLGEYEEISTESDLFNKLLKEGRIEFDFNEEDKFRILNKPYYNLNFLLESENVLTYDIKDTPYQESKLTVRIPSSLQFEIYKTINRMIIKSIAENPHLIDSFNEDSIEKYEAARKQKRQTLSDLVVKNGEIDIMELINHVNDDGYLI